MACQERRARSLSCKFEEEQTEQTKFSLLPHRNTHLSDVIAHLPLKLQVLSFLVDPVCFFFEPGGQNKEDLQLCFS